MDRLLEVIKIDKSMKNLKNESYGEKKKELNKTISADSTTKDNELEEESWICEGVIVKIKDEQLQKYYNKKAKIIKLVSPYMAEVSMLENNSKLVIDQAFLETVIPVINLILLSFNNFYQEHWRNSENIAKREIFS